MFKTIRVPNILFAQVLEDSFHILKLHKKFCKKKKCQGSPYFSVFVMYFHWSVGKNIKIFVKIKIKSV